MGQESVGQKRAAARRENREQREKLATMTNQQLVNYLNGFDAAMLDRLEKAFAKVREGQRQQEIEAIDPKPGCSRERARDTIVDTSVPAPRQLLLRAIAVSYKI